jgi:ABC-type Na+ transport system ATPase subunit NatA
MKCPTKNPHEMEEKLIDELADMKIMLAQGDLIFDAERINQRVEYKLKKLKELYLKKYFVEL